MLYGMAEPVKAAVRRMGYVVREYTPVGELLPGMAYLVRRLLENTSNEGFLRRTFVDKVSREALAGGPGALARRAIPRARPAIGSFANEPALDFSVKDHRAECRAAIEKVRTELGRHYPAVIGGREYQGEEAIVSVNPARPAEVVGTVAAVNRETGTGSSGRRPPGTAGVGRDQPRPPCRSSLPRSRRCTLNAGWN